MAATVSLYKVMASASLVPAAFDSAALNLTKTMAAAAVFLAATENATDPSAAVALAVFAWAAGSARANCSFDADCDVATEMELLIFSWQRVTQLAEDENG